VLLPERVIRLPLLNILRSAQHGLKNHLPGDFFYRQVESKHRISQVVEHAHEDDVIELPRDRIQLVDGAFSEIDIQIQSLCREPRLVQVALININSQNVRCSAPFHLNGIEAAVTANVEDCCAI